jgi:hypothetical protein
MLRHAVRHFAILALGWICALTLFASAADAAELVMYRRAGCPWCALWDREVGPVYAKTDIGRRVPLRMIEIDRGVDAAVRLRGPIRYTPTFVLVEDGEERGRIEGYPGEAFFWGLIEDLVENLPARRPNGVSSPAATINAAAMTERMP